ncbi:MAG: ATP-binding protein [Bacillota bacterium]
MRRKSLLGGGFRRQVTLLAASFIAILAGVTTFAFLLTRRVETTRLQAETERLARITAAMSVELEGHALAELVSIIGRPLSEASKYNMINEVLVVAFRGVLESYPGTVVGFETAHDRELYVYGPGGNRSRSTASRVHRILLANKALLNRVIDDRKGLVTAIPGRFGGVLIDARPVEYRGQVIGALWGMRFTGEISAAGWRTRRNVGLIIVLASIIAVVAVVRISRNLIFGVEQLEKGLQTLERDLGFRFAPMSGEFGEVAVAINRMADALQRMRGYEEQALRNQRLAELGRLVAGVAHEIRNPLTSIQGYVQYWAERPGRPPSPDSLHLVLSEAQRLNNLMERLLYFARSSTARREAVDVEALITEVAAFVAPECMTQKIEVKRDTSGRARPVEADSDQVRQVVLNLLMNAIQAMPAGGVLSVLTCYGEEEMEIRVADTGCGISPEHQRDVFSPFFTTKRNGVGLGLAISREIAHAHGGSIGFVTEPGKGTTFCVRLPYTHGGKHDDGTNETGKTDESANS